MQTLYEDLRYALRQLRQSPGFTITAVLTLAIGIGANAGLFSVMDAVVFRPLAVPHLDRVMTVYEQQNRGDNERVALANFADWQRQSRSFEEMAVHTNADMSLTGAGDAAHVQAEYASPSFFSVLQTSAFLGRYFGPGETQPGQNNVAVLNYGFWKSQFGSDSGILGRKIELDQRTYTVIGVMPRTLQYPSTADLFLPFAPTAAQFANRTAHDYLIVGRLRHGVTPAQAQQEMSAIAQRLSQQYPATNQGWTVKVEPLLEGINGDLTPLYFGLMQGAALFVLLVVCANIANLQFARGIARRPEIAMRTALGASRWRVLRQLLTENILLGILGAAAGLLVAQLYLHLTLITMPARVARYMAGWSHIALNGRALALSMLLAIGAGVVAGFAPALQALRMNLVDQLKSGSRAIAGSGRSRWPRNVFAIAQISLAVALVIGAALMSKGMTAMTHSSDRYDPSHMLTFSVHPPAARYDKPEKLAAWYNRSQDALQALPGVKHAELTNALPNSDWAWLDDCQIENRPLAPGKFQSAMHMTVSGGFLAAFHIQVISGRGFNQDDNLQSLPVAVVSRRFVARYFPGENPLGHRIRMGSAKDQTPWLTIVGVAEEADYTMFLRMDTGAVYVNSAQLPAPSTTYSVIVDGDPLSVALAARKALAALDPALPLDDVETYAQFMHERLVGLEYVAVGLGVDALIALLLAAIGIFGVMANLVAERTREIGVRLAMGAQREDVLRMILRRATILTGVGLVVGLLLALGLAHGVANLFYGVSPYDPTVFGSITAVIALIAMVSSWIPARRAAAIDPMVALRDE